MQRGGRNGGKSGVSGQPGLNRAGPRRRLAEEDSLQAATGVPETADLQAQGQGQGQGQVQVQGQVQGMAPPPPSPAPAGKRPPGTPPSPASTAPPPPTGRAPAPGPTPGTPPPPGPAPAPSTITPGSAKFLSSTKPPTFALAARYAASNALFLTEFAKSFGKMTTVGYGTPATVGATTTGKLGSVTGIDLSKCPA